LNSGPKPFCSRVSWIKSGWIVVISRPSGLSKAGPVHRSACQDTSPTLRSVAAIVGHASTCRRVRIRTCGTRKMRNLWRIIFVAQCWSCLPFLSEKHQVSGGTFLEDTCSRWRTAGFSVSGWYSMKGPGVPGCTKIWVLFLVFSSYRKNREIV